MGHRTCVADTAVQPAAALTPAESETVSSLPLTPTATTSSAASSSTRRTVPTFIVCPWEPYWTAAIENFTVAARAGTARSRLVQSTLSRRRIV